jgi:hypothetical protein
MRNSDKYSFQGALMLLGWIIFALLEQDALMLIIGSLAIGFITFLRLSFNKELDQAKSYEFPGLTLYSFKRSRYKAYKHFRKNKKNYTLVSTKNGGHQIWESVK